ncbi:MAG: hypothetical protein ACI9IV_001826 [Paracoccaceae bacterium]|jgi:hypothetical protein|tara:strand:- start:245 stop:439 length:195 start_codon:yes stop_codon:yes gene_type:complete
MTPLIKFLAAAIGTGLMMTFVLGLSQSISTGFAGFNGGLPFLVISIFVICMALYDFYDETIRKR